MGDKPTEVDCSLFGILAQVNYGMPGGPCEKLIRGTFARLKYLYKV